MTTTPTPPPTDRLAQIAADYGRRLRTDPTYRPPPPDADRLAAAVAAAEGLGWEQTGADRLPNGRQILRWRLPKPHDGCTAIITYRGQAVPTHRGRCPLRSR